MLSILGYSNPMSVAPGEDLRVMVSSQSDASTYRADLVRLFSGDDNPQGPGFREMEVDSPINGRYPVRRQPTWAGSYVRFPITTELDACESFTVLALVWPTTPKKGRQALMTRWSEREGRGFGLFIGENGAVELRVADGKDEVGRVGCEKPLIEREWYLVAATFDARTGRACVCQQALAANPLRDESEQVNEVLEHGPVCEQIPLLFGACVHGNDGSPVTCHFNGKLERPRMTSFALPPASWQTLLDDPLAQQFHHGLVGAWDLSQCVDTTEIQDLSPHGLQGETVNLPTRAVTSSRWNGDTLSWRDEPGHYAALHFHDDDLYDAHWLCDFVLRVPESTPSGVYAIRLRDEDGEDYVPFFVRPPRGGASAAIAFLASTATYIAYANNHAAYNETQEELQWGALAEVHPSDVYLSGHPELGVSIYDSHSDGSPVFYSSRLRPILSMRPRSRLWNFCADLHLIDWLDQQGYTCDVITDEDLDAEGSNLLESHQVLITGTHPEYWSKRMLDGLSAFKQNGGRLMYMGGNGFYWRIAFGETPHGVIECRKSEGVRLLDPPPGERHHSFDGNPGGLWRHLGRAPQKVAGVGTAAFGFADCGHYRRCPESFDARVAFVFEGVGVDEPIGDFGVTGGAVGFEIDRTDRLYGTPSHCLVVATSEVLSRYYVPAPEEALFLHPSMGGDENGQVRADMVFYEGPNGGAVFSTGSITWAASLAHNHYDNNVARITKNVLDRFLDPAPFG